MLTKLIETTETKKISTQELLKLLQTAAEFKLIKNGNQWGALSTIKAIEAQNILSSTTPAPQLLPDILEFITAIVTPWYKELATIKDPLLKPPFSFEHNLSKQTMRWLNGLKDRTPSWWSVGEYIKQYQPRLMPANFFAFFSAEELQRIELADRITSENLLYATPDFENELPDTPNPEEN